jgi:hypothetical protein
MKSFNVLLLLAAVAAMEIEADYNTISFSFKNNIPNMDITLFEIGDKKEPVSLTKLFTTGYTISQGNEFCFNLNVKASNGKFSTMRHVCYRFNPDLKASLLCARPTDPKFGSFVFESDGGCIECLTKQPYCIYKSFPSGLQQIQIKFE